MPLENVSFELVNSTARASEFMTWLSQRRPVLAFDTETGGLDPEKNQLRLVQFGDEHAGWAIPWHLWGGVAMEAFDRYEGELVGHNAGFDMRFLELHGGRRMKRDRVHDTMIMAAILNPGQPKGLKPLAARLVDRKAANMSKGLDEAMSKQNWTWATVPVEFEMYWVYGALDTVLTAHLHSKLRPQIEAEYHEVYELERATTGVLRDMEARGIAIDLEYTRAKATSLLSFASAVDQWCRTTYGCGPGQNAQVADVLIGLGAQLTEMTGSGSGRFKLDEDVLLTVLGVGDIEDIDTPTDRTEAQELAYQVLKRRKAEKVRTTYLDTFMERVDRFGAVHCRINQLGARTGRMSIETPALQTLPRGPLVRDCFVPRPGKVLLSADYDAVEYRLLAHFAQDQALFGAIMAEVDIHTAMARTLYGDQTIGKKDQRRQVMKNVNFARLYGAGVDKIARTAGVTVMEAKKFLTKYDETFPGVKAFTTTVGNVATQRKHDEGTGYVKTPIGRYQPSEDRKEYSLVNYLIQGTAADVLKEALLRLDAAGLGDAMLLPVHDEIIFEVNQEDVAEATSTIMEVMTDNRWAVPLTVGIDGPLDRWGAKYR